MKIQTHFVGCWRDPKHHDCAVALLEDAVRVLGDLEAPWCKACENKVALVGHESECALAAVLARIGEVK